MHANKIRKLYVDKLLNTREIGEKLGISQWSVISLMRRRGIPRRTTQESNKILFEKTPLSFKRVKPSTQYDKNLKLAALMLYWAEGGKSDGFKVDFANSDEKMVRIFLAALRRIYGANENRIRALIYCYKNQNIENLLNYWSRYLKLEKAQFSKTYVRNNFDEKKINKLRHGVIHIRYSDKRLFRQIMADIDIIQSKLNSQGS